MPVDSGPKFKTLKLRKRQWLNDSKWAQHDGHTATVALEFERDKYGYCEGYLELRDCSRTISVSFGAPRGYATKKGMFHVAAIEKAKRLRAVLDEAIEFMESTRNEKGEV